MLSTLAICYDLCRCCMLRPTTPYRRLGLLRGRYDALLDRIILAHDYLHRMSSMYMSSHTMSIHIHLLAAYSIYALSALYPIRYPIRAASTHRAPSRARRFRQGCCAVERSRAVVCR